MEIRHRVIAGGVLTLMVAGGLVLSRSAESSTPVESSGEYTVAAASSRHEGRSPHEFGRAMTRYSVGDYKPFSNLQEVLDLNSFAAVGRLVGVKNGRKAIKGRGCEDPKGNASCPDDPSEWSYNSYANIVIDVEQVLKGSLPSPGEPLYAEIPWPKNVGLGELKQSLPRGARVVILGAPIGDDLRKRAMPLEEANIVPRGLVKKNLITFAPLGLGFETVDHWIVVPNVDQDVLDQFLAPTGAQTFDDLIAVIAQHGQAGQ